MMKNSVDVNNEDSVQSYDQGSKYEQSGNIGDQQQLSFTTEGAHSKLNYNQSPTTSLILNSNMFQCSKKLLLLYLIQIKFSW